MPMKTKFTDPDILRARQLLRRMTPFLVSAIVKGIRETKAEEQERHAKTLSFYATKKQKELS